MNFFPEEWNSSVSALFDLDQEANLPTWFSSSLLFSVALASLIIVRLSSKVKDLVKRRSFWLGFSLISIYLSLDEASGLHELLSTLLGIRWIWIYIPLGTLCFIIIAYSLEFTIKNQDLTNHILGGYTVFITGALSSEIFNFYFVLGKAEAAIQEGFEMLGTIIILTGCLKEINRLHQMPDNDN